MNMFLAFLLRDLTIEKTYRFHLAAKLGGVALQLAVFFYLSRFLGKPDYFIFVYCGIMFSGFFQFWLNVFAENIRQEQYWGTLEPVFMAQGRPLAVILFSASGKAFLAVAELVLLLLLGKLFFGHVFVLNLAGFLALAVINSLAFAGLGLLSGSFIMYFKRGDPVNWVVGAVFDLVSGVYFSVSVLPGTAAALAQKLPTTSALNLWRSAIVDGKMPEISQFFAQAAWAVVLLGAGVWAFSTAFNKTRMKGDLGNY